MRSLSAGYSQQPGRLSATGLSGRLVLATLVLALLFTSAVSAQDVRGRVQGIVTDASGAVIPGAKVTLRNVNTAVEVSRSSNDTGQYLFDFVLPGSYEMRVENEGFRTFVQQNILVQTRADVTINARMELGAVAETVTVEETPVAVSFNRTTMETTLDTKMTNELPIIHRNPFLLLQLDPAVIYRGNQETSPYHHWAASQLDVGGNTSYKNNVLLDGVPQLVGAKGTYVPAMDAVSEVNVQQNAVDAEYGHSAGGIVSLQMKSGSNEWHGSAYYLGRNPVFNARPNSLTSQKSVVRRSVWGVTTANPIIRNKVFNFFAYEGQNTREPLTLTRTLPTDLEKRGDFSKSLNRNGAVREIYDPFTTVTTGNTATRDRFTNNVIPTARLDATALRVMENMFQPNNPGDNVAGLNNFRFTYPQQFKYYNFSDRVDYNVSDNVKVFGRISRFHTDQVDPDFTNGSILQPRAGSERHTWQTSGDVVWTINPTTVFNVRGSWSKITDRFSAPEVEIGERGLERLWPGNKWYTSHVRDIPTVYHPEIIVNAESNSNFGRSGYWFQEPQTYNWDVKVSKQAGRHYVKVGHQYRAQRVEAARPQGMQFTFRADETANTYLAPNTATIGHAYASMMLGTIGAGRGVATVPINRPDVDVYGFYVHDDFKINQRVTLNVGVRYEYETAMRDSERRLSRFMDFAQGLPDLQAAMAPLPDQAAALRRQPLSIVGAWIFTDDNNPGTWNPQKNIILPRAGLAIRLNDRTALRLGYARYAIPPIQGRDALATHQFLDPLGSTPYTGFTATTGPQSVLAGIPRTFLADPYPSSGTNANPLIEPAGKSNGIYAAVGSGAPNDGQFFQQNFRQGINDRFNVSLQREIFSRIVVDATYFTNFGHNHPVNRQINRADPRIGYDAGAAVNASVPNPFFNLPKNIVPGELRNQRNVSVSQLTRPYPYYTDISILGEGVGHQRYNAFQLKIQRPFANGFNFLIGYNYNRGRAEEYYDDVDEFDSRLGYQRDPLSGQTVTFASIYELPFGRGRRFGSDMPRGLNAVFGGWAVSGLYRYLSGQLLSFRTNSAVVSGDPTVDNPTRQRWFNTDAFTRLPAFTRRANPWIFDDLRGPHFSNLDMTVSKMVPVTERLKLEIRMEAYNLSNSFMGQNPITDVTSGSFGQVTAQLVTHSGREFQYSARFIW